MALTLICGAECGIITAGLPAASANRHWFTVTGAPAIETSVVRSGSRSLRFVAAATNPSIAPGTTGSSSVCYLRMYFRMTDAAPSSTTTIAYIDSGTSASSGYISVDTGGVLYAAFNGTTGQQNGPTLANDTWYGIEAEFDIHANPNVIRWRTWDAATGWTDRTDVSVAQAAATYGTAHELGVASGPTSGLTVYLDDILVGWGTTAGEDYSTTTPKGGKVLRLVTNGDGNHNIAGTPEFSYNAAGGTVADSATNVYTYLDDDDQTVITDFIRKTVGTGTAYCALVYPDTAESSIRAVAVTSTHHSAGTGANHMSIRISDNNWSNETQVWNLNDVSDTTAHFRHKVVATPPSGGTWTRDKLNSTEIRFGYGTDVSAIPYYDSISIEYEAQAVSIIKRRQGVPAYHIRR